MDEKDELPDRGGQMSFLEHLDELRRRLVNIVVIIVVAFVFCWFVSGYIFDFLSVPIRRALSEAERRETPLVGLTGSEHVFGIGDLKPGDGGRYVFNKATKLGTAVLQPGTSVNAQVAIDADGKPSLFTDEPIIAGDAVIPAGVKLPIDLANTAAANEDAFERLIVTTVPESFTLFVTVSLYAAI